jgi:hypothetical protein
MIRLARNVVCHERTFCWRGAVELHSQLICYFRMFPDQVFVSLIFRDDGALEVLH